MMNEKIDIVNMKEAVQRAAELGIPLSEYTLRRAIRSGQLPCRIVGRTYLISWEKLLRWISCEDGCDNPETDEAI